MYYISLLAMSKVSHKRHIVKTITWRIVGTIDTIIIGWIVTGKFEAGISIGTAEFITKTILYYAHERAWYHYKLFEGKSRIRHIIKTFTWRIIGTLDTILIGWIVTGNSTAGLSIGLIEFVSKMILYYFHERAWYRSSFGIEQNDN